jgi:hypothetical protein
MRDLFWALGADCQAGIIDIGIAQGDEGITVHQRQAWENFVGILMRQRHIRVVFPGGEEGSRSIAQTQRPTGTFEFGVLLKLSVTTNHC